MDTCIVSSYITVRPDTSRDEEVLDCRRTSLRLANLHVAPLFLPDPKVTAKAAINVSPTAHDTERNEYTLVLPFPGLPNISFHEFHPPIMVNFPADSKASVAVASRALRAMYSPLETTFVPVFRNGLYDDRNVSHRVVDKSKVLVVY